MKQQILKNINNNIERLTNFTIDGKTTTHWDLNALLEKHYAMRKIMSEDEGIDLKVASVLLGNLTQEIAGLKEKD